MGDAFCHFFHESFGLHDSIRLKLLFDYFMLDQNLDLVGTFEKYVYCSFLLVCMVSCGIV